MKIVKHFVLGMILALMLTSVVSAQEKYHLLVVSGHARSDVSTATKTIMDVGVITQ